MMCRILSVGGVSLIAMRRFEQFTATTSEASTRGKAWLYVGVFVWRKAAADLAHPCMIDPNEGVDRFGNATQAKGPEMMIARWTGAMTDIAAPYAAVAASSAG